MAKYTPYTTRGGLHGAGNVERTVDLVQWEEWKRTQGLNVL